MSIQRWSIDSEMRAMCATDHGTYVRFADHVAAVAEAEHGVGRAKYARSLPVFHAWNAGLDAAREAVAALSIDGSVWVLRHEALAAIDALRGAK